MYRLFIKRVLDFGMAMFLMILLLPVFLLLTFLLLLANNGKPFFTQKRPGRNEKIFRVIKFKTMNDRKDAEGALLPDRDRLTPVGSFVRKTSLDEIPQLINVILGQMSFVGPRPLLIRYLPYYTKREKKRHTVRPGITGLAQVSGRNLLKWDDKLSMDADYVENYSFLLDMKILVKTFFNVISAKDVIVDPTSIMKSLDEERSTKMSND